MPNVINPQGLTRALNNALTKFSHVKKEDASQALRATVIDNWTRIIKETPVGEKFGGSARGGWLINQSVSSELGDGDQNKGVSYVVSAIPNDIFKGSLYLYNNLPYIQVLEFGLYPNPSKTGERTSGGFSTQAPAGMVRKNTNKFGRTLNKFFKAVS